MNYNMKVNGNQILQSKGRRCVKQNCSGLWYEFIQNDTVLSIVLSIIITAELFT